MSAPKETRDRLIETAMELFAFQGYGGTGVAEIARKSGVLPGSLHYFFPSKEDLLLATLKRRLVLLRPEVLEPLWLELEDPIERVYALMGGYRRMLELTEFRHGCPIGNLVIELCETHPRTRGLLVENFENWLAEVEGCFRAARERLPRECDTRRLAVFVLTTMEGAVMLARAYRNLEAYDAAVTTLRDHVERLLVAGAAERAHDGRAAI